MFLRKFDKFLMGNTGPSDHHPLWSVPIFLRVQQKFGIDGVDPLLWTEQWVPKGFTIISNMMKDFWEVGFWLRKKFANLVTGSFTLSFDFFRSELRIGDGFGDEGQSQRRCLLEVCRLVYYGFS